MKKAKHLTHHRRGLAPTHFFNPTTKKIERIGADKGAANSKWRKPYALQPVPADDVKRRIVEGRMRHPFGKRY